MGYFSAMVNHYPRSQAPPSFPSLAVRKSGRGPGIFYHVSDVEGKIWEWPGDEATIHQVSALACTN